MDNPRTRVRRLPEKQRRDRKDLDAVLDAGVVAHLAVVDAGGQPYVVPTAYARVDDILILHGSTGSRLYRALAAGARTCLTVTLFDGFVLARSAFESSMHYRSAMLLGTCSALDGDDAKVAALAAMSEQWLPGRWADIRPPSRKELDATTVLVMAIHEWSVKVSDGPPEDAEADLDLRVWAGVLPVRTLPTTPLAAPDLRPVAVPPYVTMWKAR